MQLLCERTGPGHAAHVGGDHHHVLAVSAELLGVVVHEDGVAQQVVHRDVEEALDLGGVEVHGQHPVGAGGHQHVGHQLGRDGIASLGFPVLPGIAVIRHDGGDAARRGPLQRVDHDEQLHQVPVYRIAGGLNDKHVAAANGLIQGDEDLAVRERADLGLAQRGAHESADLLRQLGIRVASKNLDILPVRNHFQRPLSY